MKLVKSSLLVKLVILILVVYATVTLVSLRKQITEKNEQEAILNSSIARAPTARACLPLGDRRRAPWLRRLSAAADARVSRYPHF